MILSIPMFWARIGHECGRSPKIYTIRKIDDTISISLSVVNGLEMQSENLSIHEDGKAYITYYEKALNCTSNIPVKYSVLARASGGKEHQHREFFSHFSGALTALGWNEIPYAIFEAALAHTTISFMSTLERQLSSDELRRPKTGTGSLHKDMQWSQNQKEEMMNMAEALAHKYPEYRSDITGI